MGKDLLYPLRRLHGKMHERSVEKQKAEELCKKINAIDKDRLILVMTPTHGNLGDQAIAKAECEFLNEMGVDFAELTDKNIRLLQSTKKMHVLDGRPLLLHGGGYLGTLWFRAEEGIREIISKNKNADIIALPNTIFYEDSDWGKRELEKSEKIYNSHNSLKLCAREKISYAAMKELYKDVVLIPDMVLSMKGYECCEERNGCLLCLRGDVEKTRTEEDEAEVLRQVKPVFGDEIFFTDMVENHSIPIENRNEELAAKFKQFSGAKLVVTDRLHGMIFCAITGTPCIVINSRSPKVKGCYEWIRNLEYIRFADDLSEIGELYKQIPNKKFEYDNRHLDAYYEELRSYIREMLVE